MKELSHGTYLITIKKGTNRPEDCLIDARGLVIADSINSSWVNEGIMIGRVKADSFKKEQQ